MYIEKYTSFYQKPDFAVKKSKQHDDTKYPKVICEVGLIEIIPLRLMKEGIMGGDYLKIISTPVDVIIKLWHYIQFCNDYENEMYNINTQKDN